MRRTVGSEGRMSAVRSSPHEQPARGPTPHFVRRSVPLPVMLVYVCLAIVIANAHLANTVT